MTGSEGWKGGYVAGTGRPPKAKMTNDEFLRAIEIMAGGKKTTGGLGTVAVEISRMRGAHVTTSTATRRERTVSATWVERQFRAMLPNETTFHAKLSTQSERQAIARKLLSAWHSDLRVSNGQEGPLISEEKRTEPLLEGSVQISDQPEKEPGVGA